MQSPDNLIEIRNLKTHFKTDEGLVKAIDGVDLDVPRGRVAEIEARLQALHPEAHLEGCGHRPSLEA